MTPHPRAAEPKSFFVTGLTGQQGGAVARELLGRGHKVRGVTRDPSSEKARQWGAQGVEVVQGDFEKPESIEHAAKGTDAAFIMGTPFEKGADAETREGKDAITAVARAGVRHIVYSSVSDADRGTGIPHFDSKYAVESHLRSQECPTRSWRLSSSARTC